MELQKELLKKHLKNRGLTKYSMNAEQYEACLDAISEALSIGRSEQLSLSSGGCYECPKCGKALHVSDYDHNCKV